MMTQTVVDSGLVTKRSKFSVQETIEMFEAAVEAEAASGWMVFSRIDHAAAARAAGLDMRPRTVIVFGNPRNGTPSMAASATLAIDLPMKALVWQDDQDGVWLTFNSAEYLAAEIYPRHGLAVTDNATATLAGFLAELGERSTQ